MSGADPEFEDLYLDALLELADHDIPPVFHIWWSANSMFPHKSLSDRLSLSERVIRSLLDQGLVELVRSEEDRSPIPPGQWNDVLRRHFTWHVNRDGAATIFFRITSAGRDECAELSAKGYSFWRQPKDGPPSEES